MEYFFHHCTYSRNQNVMQAIRLCCLMWWRDSWQPLQLQTARSTSQPVRSVSFLLYALLSEKKHQACHCPVCLSGSYCMHCQRRIHHSSVTNASPIKQVGITSNEFQFTNTRMYVHTRTYSTCTVCVILELNEYIWVKIQYCSCVSIQDTVLCV